MIALLALGGNIPSPAGPPRETVLAALAALVDKGVTIRAASALYQTPCFPAGAGPDFVNSAAEVSFDGPITALAELARDVETQFGRTRRARWSARTLDIDILAAGQVVLPDRATVQRWIDLPPDAQATRAPNELLVPHPRLQDRAFVLIPLMDIAPDWRHPILGRTVREMAAGLPDGETAAITPLDATHQGN